MHKQDSEATIMAEVKEDSEGKNKVLKREVDLYRGKKSHSKCDKIFSVVVVFVLYRHEDLEGVLPYGSQWGGEKMSSSLLHKSLEVDESRVINANKSSLDNNLR